MNRAVAIILAAGSGERIREGTPKAFLKLGERSILQVAAAGAAACPAISSLVVVVPEGFERRALAAVTLTRPVTVVAGGSSRHASVRAGLAAVPGDARAVVCHDAARPFASAALFDAVLDALSEADGAVPVIDVPDTVKRVREGLVVGTEPRDGLGLAQTPQAFRVEALREAHAHAERDGLEFSDDAAVLEWGGYRVRAVAGEEINFKITTPADLERAARLVAEARRG